MFVCLFVCLSVCLFVCLFVCTKEKRRSELLSNTNRSEAVVDSTNVAVEANGEEEIIEVKSNHYLQRRAVF